MQARILTEGPITRQIIRLTLPVLGTSFVQMAYNLTDMLWLGRVGSDAVAAVGIASYFTWIGVSLLLITRIGAEVGVSQSIGLHEARKAAQYAGNAIALALILATLYGVGTYLLAPVLVPFFQLGDGTVEAAAISYVRIISIGAIFYYPNTTYTGILNGTGNAKLPFRVNAIGLLINVLLNPVLIFGWGPFPAMGSDGSALATLFSRAVVCLIFIYLLAGKNSVFPERIRIRLQLMLKDIKWIIRIGFPVAVHSILFASFAVVLARIVSRWGPMPIAVQSVGAQIEAFSWMTAGGFSTALGVFTGQNFGAGNWDRIFRGYLTTIKISGAIGIVVTICFLFFGKEIFSLFLSEPDAISLGVRYLSILAISQFFMCVEITTGGVFNGIGRTLPSSLVGIVFTGLRIPLALLLTMPGFFGVTGVWWSISITSIIKGIVLFSWFFLYMKKHPYYLVSEKRKFYFIRLLPSRIRQDLFDTKAIADDEI